MKNSEHYSFSTGALYPLESEDALKQIKNAGFPNAELMPQSLSDSSKESAKRLERIGLRVASIHYPLAFFPLLYTAHRSMRDDGRKYSLELLALGERLGTEVLVVHPHIPSNKGYDALLDDPVVENLLWLAEECQKRGILTAMENSPKTCGTPELLLSYIAKLNHPNIKPMVDTTEAREAGGDPAPFIAAVSPCHLHISDYMGESKHLPAGEGDTDFTAVAKALKGYQGFYTLEPAYRYYIEHTEQKLRAGYAFLARTFPDTL